MIAGNRPSLTARRSRVGGAVVPRVEDGSPYDSKTDLRSDCLL